jgi:hypothetical protein
MKRKASWLIVAFRAKLGILSGGTAPSTITLMYCEKITFEEFYNLTVTVKTLIRGAFDGLSVNSDESEFNSNPL